MNDSLVRKFCEYRLRWLIVATATTLLGMATVMPEADDYFDKRNSRNTLTAALTQIQQTAAHLPELEQKVDAIKSKLAALESRAVSEEFVPKFRSELVEIVRQAGCQIRRIDVGPPAARPWKSEDNPLTEAASSTNTSPPTPFLLERRSLSLAVDGPMASLYDLLARLRKSNTIAHLHQMRFQPAGANDNNVTMEVELWLYALTRAAG